MKVASGQKLVTPEMKMMFGLVGAPMNQLAALAGMKAPSKLCVPSATNKATSEANMSVL
jgi:hypothetical protein